MRLLRSTALSSVATIAGSFVITASVLMAPQIGHFLGQQGSPDEPHSFGSFAAPAANRREPKEQVGLQLNKVSAQPHGGGPAISPSKAHPASSGPAHTGGGGTEWAPPAPPVPPPPPVSPPDGNGGGNGGGGGAPEPHGNQSWDPDDPPPGAEHGNKCGWDNVTCDKTSGAS